MFVLTEKPSVANDIAAALDDFQKAYSPFGSFWKNSHDDIIVSAAGHLLELFQPEDYNPSWKNWNLEDLPIIPENFKYQPIKESFDVLKKIKYCFDHFDSTDFVLATDAEREGEHIGALILNYVGFKHYDTAKRFWVSEASLCRRPRTHPAPLRIAATSRCRCPSASLSSVPHPH